MADAQFHDQELDAFMDQCKASSLTGEDLKWRFTEDVTDVNISSWANAKRRKLRDFLEDNGVPGGRGSRDQIKIRLPHFLQFGQNGNPLEYVPASPHSGKRDFLKITRYKDDKYAGSYECPLLGSVRRRFEQDCIALEVPEGDRLQLVYTMIRGEPLRYFMDEVQPHASAAADAFVMVQAKYMSSAHRDRYIHEWNALSFRSFVKPGISSAQALDELFARARDLQAMLKAPYDSDLLLRDTITRAVQDESFYGLLSATDIPADSGILHTRLQKCIQVSRSAVRNTSSNVVTQSGSDATYL